MGQIRTWNGEFRVETRSFEQMYNVKRWLVIHGYLVDFVPYPGRKESEGVGDVCNFVEPVSSDEIINQFEYEDFWRIREELHLTVPQRPKIDYIDELGHLFDEWNKDYSGNPYPLVELWEPTANMKTMLKDQKKWFYRDQEEVVTPIEELKTGEKGTYNGIIPPKKYQYEYPGKTDHYVPDQPTK